MRFGNIILDTKNMEIEEIGNLITELKKIKSRKIRAQQLKNSYNELIAAAKEDGFTFIDKDFGFVHEVDDIKMLDERA